MPHRFVSLTAVAVLLAGGPAAAHAADLPAVQRDAVRSASSIYIGALASADYDQLSAIVTPGFRQIGPDGRRRGIGDVLGAASHVTLEGSKPQGRLTFGEPVLDGDERVSQPLADQSYTYTFVAGAQRLVRYYASHTLTLVQTVDGSWRVAADRVESENTYY